MTAATFRDTFRIQPLTDEIRPIPHVESHNIFGWGDLPVVGDSGFINIVDELSSTSTNVDFTSIHRQHSLTASADQQNSKRVQREAKVPPSHEPGVSQDSTEKKVTFDYVHVREYAVVDAGNDQQEGDGNRISHLSTLDWSVVSQQCFNVNDFERFERRYRYRECSGVRGRLQAPRNYRRWKNMLHDDGMTIVEPRRDLPPASVIQMSVMKRARTMDKLNG